MSRQDSCTPANLTDLRRNMEALAAAGEVDREEALPILDQFLTALEDGRIRAASPTEHGWEVQGWVKRGILLGFRIGINQSLESAAGFHFRDRDTYPTWDPSSVDRNVRIVPGGSTVRRGAHLGDGVVMMPPAYVNVGGYVGAGSMIDSHALVGSCAQIGSGVHLSAAVQIGGVLEPIGALPVVIEDDSFLGGGSAVYEGTRVGVGAVLAPGVILTGSVAVYDLVRETVHRRDGESPLAIPAGAVVVPGTRPASGPFARSQGLQVSAPIIVKYRDAGTDASLVLEEALR